jgi:hypothetical protein
MVAVGEKLINLTNMAVTAIELKAGLLLTEIPDVLFYSNPGNLPKARLFPQNLPVLLSITFAFCQQ